jgi:hypothetical protein
MRASQLASCSAPRGIRVTYNFKGDEYDETRLLPPIRCLFENYSYRNIRFIITSIGIFLTWKDKCVSLQQLLFLRLGRAVSRKPSSNDRSKSKSSSRGLSCPTIDIASGAEKPKKVFFCRYILRGAREISIRS